MILIKRVYTEGTVSMTPAVQLSEDTHNFFFKWSDHYEGGGRNPLTTKQKNNFFIKGINWKKYEPLRSRGGGGTQTLVVQPLKQHFFFMFVFPNHHQQMMFYFGGSGMDDKGTLVFKDIIYLFLSTTSMQILNIKL